MPQVMSKVTKEVVESYLGTLGAAYSEDDIFGIREEIYEFIS